MSLQGTIETFAIADVIRLLAATNKSGRLQVQGPGRAGTVWVESAQILGAESPSSPFALSAVDVLFQMLRFEKGSFNFELDKRPPSPAEPVGIETALSEAEAMFVEWRGLEATVPNGQAWVSLAEQLPKDSVSVSAADWRTVYSIGSGCSVTALGQSLQRGELDTARAVSALFGLGLVTIGEAPAAPKTAATDTIAAPTISAAPTMSADVATAAPAAPAAVAPPPPDPGAAGDGDARRRLDALAGTLGLDSNGSNGSTNGTSVPPPPPPPPAFESTPIAFAPPPAAAPPLPEIPTPRAEIGLNQPEGQTVAEPAPFTAPPAGYTPEVGQPAGYPLYEAPGYGADYPGAYTPASEFAPPPGYPAPPAWGDGYDYGQPPQEWAPAPTYQYGETVPPPGYEAPVAPGYGQPVYEMPSYEAPAFDTPVIAPEPPLTAPAALSFGLPEGLAADVASFPSGPLPPPAPGAPLEAGERLAPPAPPVPGFVGEAKASEPASDGVATRDVWSADEVARVRAVFDTSAPPPPPAPPVIGREPLGQTRDGWTTPSAWFDAAAPERIAPPPPPPPPPGLSGLPVGASPEAGTVLTTVGQAASDDPNTIEQQLFNLSDRAREAVKRSTGLFDGRPKR